MSLNISLLIYIFFLAYPTLFPQGALHVSKLKALQAVLQQKSQEQLQSHSATTATIHPTPVANQATTATVKHIQPPPPVQGMFSGYSDSDSDSDSDNEDDSNITSDTLTSTNTNTDTDTDIDTYDKANEEDDENILTDIVDDDGSIWRLEGDIFVCIGVADTTIDKNIKSVSTSASTTTTTTTADNNPQQQENPNIKHQSLSKSSKIQLVAYWKDEDELLQEQIDDMMQEQGSNISKEPLRKKRHDPNSLEAFEADQFLASLTSKPPQTETKVQTKTLNPNAQTVEETSSPTTTTSRPAVKPQEQTPLQILLKKVQQKKETLHGKAQQILIDNATLSKNTAGNIKRNISVVTGGHLSTENPSKKIKIDDNLTQDDIVKVQSHQLEDDDKSSENNDDSDDSDDSDDDFDLGIDDWRSRV